MIEKINLSNATSIDIKIKIYMIGLDKMSPEMSRII